MTTPAELEAEVSAFVANVGMPLLEEHDDLALAQVNLAMIDLLPQVNEMIDVVHRHHLEAAIHRVGILPGQAAESRVLAVGFTDLVGFTALSHQLSAGELAATVADFEARASDLIASSDARLVKLIGDEVMFVAPDAPTACEVGLRLVETFEGDPLLPPLRGGLAAGDMLTQDGDYYGPVVNLASRAAKVARPRTIVVPDAFRRKVKELTDAYTFRPFGPRKLKGFRHLVPLFALRRR